MAAVPEGLSARGEALYPILRAFVGEDVPANRALETLRELGLGYRRSVFLSDYRILRSAQQKAATIKYVPKSAVISERHYTPAKTPLSVGNYQTTFRIEGTDLETGESFIKNVTIAHDTLMTREELEEAAFYRALETSPNLEIERIIPTSARKQPEWLM